MFGNCFFKCRSLTGLKTILDMESILFIFVLKYLAQCLAQNEWLINVYLTKLRSSSKGSAWSLTVPLESSKFTIFQEAEAVANKSGDRPSESVLLISAP